MSSRKSRGNRNNKTKLIIGAVLLLLLLAVGLYFILNKEEEPEKDTRKTSTTGSSTGSSKTNYVKPPEQDSSINTEFIKARDKLLALYEDPTKPKLTDTDKTALFKQIDFLVEMPGSDKPSTLLSDEDIYNKSIYNIAASIDIRNETVFSNNAVNQFSNQLDLVNGKEFIDFININNMRYEKCSNDITPQEDLLSNTVCKLDKLPAIEKFDIYNNLIAMYRKNTKFTSGEKDQAVDLLHKAIRYAGFNIDLRERIKSCSDLLIFNMLLSNNIPEIINIIPTEYYDLGDDSRFIGNTNKVIKDLKCITSYTDWTDAKTSGKGQAKTLESKDGIYKCKLKNPPNVVINDSAYKRLMYKFVNVGDWTDNERNGAIVLAGKFLAELKKTDPDLPSLGLQGYSNTELYNMLKSNNKIDFYNATNNYFMAYGMEDIDWKYTSDSFDCSKNYRIINLDGSTVADVNNYTSTTFDLPSWCKISKRP